MPALPEFDAVILAGGTARRLGGIDKTALAVGGLTLLEHVLAAVTGARSIVVVGPPRPVDQATVTWCREDPPGGGPLAGLAAGMPYTSAPCVLVLGGDSPGLGPAITPLRQALETHPGADAALLVDAAGRQNPLAAAWRRTSLVAALAACAPHVDRPLRLLTEGVGVVEVADDDGWGADCDTWADLDLARARFERMSR